MNIAVLCFYWDRSIMTDRYIFANKPDIVLVYRVARRALIVDVIIPHNDNLVRAEKEILCKYLDQAHEIIGCHMGCQCDYHCADNGFS